MWSYIGKRIVQMFITLLLFQIATYILIDLQPGDVTDLLIGNPDITAAERARIAADLGLDGPLPSRIWTYLTNFYTGNLGVSMQQYPRPVSEILMTRLPRTFTLFMAATILSFWLGYIAGKFLAWKRGGAWEYASTITGVTLFTIFTPLLAYILLWLFARQLDSWISDTFGIDFDLPISKFNTPSLWRRAPYDTNTVFSWMNWNFFAIVMIILIALIVSNYIPRRYRPALRIGSVVLSIGGSLIWWAFISGVGLYAWDIVKHLFLPILTLTLISFGGNMLLTRTSMLETLREDYIETARAKGLPEGVIRNRHAARNAVLPVWTALVFSLSNTISGGIITETVFSWPGIGATLVQSVSVSDFAVAMGALTLIGIMTLIGHLIVDIGYVFLDPRIRIH